MYSSTWLDALVYTELADSTGDALGCSFVRGVNLVLPQARIQRCGVCTDTLSYRQARKRCDGNKFFMGH